MCVCVCRYDVALHAMRSALGSRHPVTLATIHHGIEGKKESEADVRDSLWHHHIPVLMAPSSSRTSTAATRPVSEKAQTVAGHASYDSPFATVRTSDGEVYPTDEGAEETALPSARRLSRPGEDCESYDMEDVHTIFGSSQDNVSYIRQVCM